MNTLDAVATVNLRKTEDGTIRIGETRVALESVVHHFLLGSTAEDIAQKFPALRLSEVYGVIGYILEHRAEVEEYVLDQERAEDLVEAEVIARYGNDMAEFRERLVARDVQRRAMLNQQ